MKWRPLNTKCAVEVNIRFLDEKRVILGNETGITGNRTFFCANEYDNASSVIIWATFNNRSGDYSLPVALETTTTTTTTSSPTTATTFSTGNILYEVNETE